MTRRRKKDQEAPSPLQAAINQRGRYLAEALPLFFESLRSQLHARLYFINAQLRDPDQHLVVAGNESINDILIHQNSEKWFSKGISYEIGTGTFSGEVLETHRKPSGQETSQDKLFLWTSWQGLIVLTSHRNTYDAAAYATYILKMYVEDAKLPCRFPGA